MPETSPESRYKRLAVPLGLALIWAASVALIPRSVLRDYNNLFYDSFFRTRRVEPQTDGPVVIVAADNPSVVRLSNSPEHLHDLPWPRDKWAQVIQYAERCGARAVVFDILFDQQSEYVGTFDDDVNMGQAATGAKIPVIFAVECRHIGDAVAFAPYDPDHKTWKPTQGNVIVTQSTLRFYEPTNNALPSLAAATLGAIDRGEDIFGENQFYVHYYGRNAFQYVSAADVFDACKSGGSDKDAKSEWFKDKIVLAGVTATAGFDQKVSPFSNVFPGVE